jgi:hypothetical protein
VTSLPDAAIHAAYSGSTTLAPSLAGNVCVTALCVPAFPSVTNVSPDFGAPAGGTAVTITGTNFTGATAVRFGATPASSVTVTSDTSITATAPPGTGTANVAVTNPSGTNMPVTADRFSYGALVTGVAPNSGSAGGHTTVTITGEHFLGTRSVHFGTSPALTVVINSTGTTIVATSPPEVGTGVRSVDVTVTTAADTSATSPADVFTYAPPMVRTVTPAISAAGGGTEVTIFGGLFYGASSVTFGLARANSFAVNSTGTVITAYTPKQQGTGLVPVDVTVTTAAGSGTLANGLAYVAPVITAVSPTSGSGGGGTPVVMTGTDLSGTTSVMFGGASATITHETATTLSVVTPPGTGKVAVSATSSAGVGTLVPAFTYLKPALVRLTPTTGPSVGGTLVTITGTNLHGATGVSFGSIPATRYTVISASSIVAISPAGSGAVNVTVTDPAGSSAVVAADKFTY